MIKERLSQLWGYFDLVLKHIAVNELGGFGSVKTFLWLCIDPLYVIIWLICLATFLQWERLMWSMVT